jgi:hypothetical protein
VNYYLGTLAPGGLTDTVLYGSLNKVQFLGNQVQLSPDVFNFDPEGRSLLRDIETNVAQQTLGQGLPGTNFRTIFVGPTPVPVH